MKQHKSIKIEQSLIGKIEELAKKENRSFNNMVETILERRFNMQFIRDGWVEDNVCEHTFEPTSQRNGSPIICSKCGIQNTGKFITN